MDHDPACGGIAVMQLAKAFSEKEKKLAETAEQKVARSYVLELGFPPSVNTLFPTIRNKRVLSKLGKAYRSDTHGRVLEQHGCIKPLTGPLRASVELIPGDGRTRDIDNYNKALFDSLKYAGVIEDDSQLKELHIFMREPGEDSKCIVVLEEI